MAQFSKLSALSVALAAGTLSTAPAAAAELSDQASMAASTLPQVEIFSADEMAAEHHRRWRGYRYRGYRHRRHRIDASDVIAGALVIGGIAAIASAASNSERRERRYRDERFRDDYLRDRRDTRRSSTSGRGIDGAVDQCLNEIERDVRVDEVQSVDRTAEGWRVTGTIFNGDRFNCTIGSDGRIESVNYGDSFSALTPSSDRPVQDNQYSDDRYRSAWAQVEREEQVDPEAERRSQQVSSYPGGPIDGDLEEGSAEDRYSMADASAN
ncbi:hypothetical protein [Altererythrobacter ishigakiensis]|uniref:YpeB-like protein with protease inhibitory function n=1 Tax=Altererythrobacter ishigakiensis TaxID=476157 RepID=A0A562UXP2_9SPHN|nr:hypothetical protein [Altererythrobacter ishigakiensis]TWJ10353.1 hypothetical protein JN10_2017 [Altererythrobacter ishigakiensis]